MKCKHLHLLALPALLSLSIVGQAQNATAPNLGAASGFALFSPAGAIGNAGLTVVNGDVGTISGAVSGISTTAPVPPAQTGTINGALYQGGTYTSQVDSFVQAAYVSLAGNTIDSTLVYTAGLGNKQVLKPYVYYLGGATTLVDTLFLDAQNNPNGLFIFQVNGVLNTGVLSRIVLLNGASLSNVYWQVNGAVNLGVNSIFQGTMIANGAISMGNGATLLGRGLSTFDAINLDSNMASFSPPAPLPINLLSFVARKDNGGVINITWATASEHSSSAFVVERSSNGRENTWEAIGRQSAAGNSASVKQYSMQDNNANDGANYYRLRSINLAGTYSLSNVAVVYSDVKTASISVFPNPAINSFAVTGAVSGSQIIVMDMNGRTLMNQTSSGGSDLIKMGSLTSGSYLLHAVSADGHAVTLQMNKQ